MGGWRVGYRWVEDDLDVDLELGNLIGTMRSCQGLTYRVSQAGNGVEDSYEGWNGDHVKDYEANVRRNPTLTRAEIRDVHGVRTEST